MEIWLLCLQWHWRFTLVAGLGLAVGGPVISRAVHISSFILIFEGGGSRTARFCISLSWNFWPHTVLLRMGMRAFISPSTHELRTSLLGNSTSVGQQPRQ